MSYLNPFQGIPKKLDLSPGCLVNPYMYLELLLDFNPRRHFKEQGKESFYKQVFVAPEKEEKDEKRERKLKEFLNEYPDSPIAHMFIRALDGDAAEKSRIESMGAYQLCFHQIMEPSYPLSYLLELDHLSHAWTVERGKDNYIQAWEEFLNSPLIEPAVWPDLFEVLGRKLPNSELLCRWVIAMELHLSHLVAGDVEYQRSMHASDTPIKELVPKEDESTENPAALFFQWLRTTTGTSSLPELMRLDANQLLDADESKWKRWKRGDFFPSFDSFEKLVEVFKRFSSAEAIQHRFYMAKALNFWGYYSTSLMQKYHDLPNETKRALAPFPIYPHGYSSFSSWIQARYPFWLDYHQKRYRES